MKLYLSSFKLGNKTEELKEWITNNDNKICIIPNALDVSAEGKKPLRIQEGIEELERLGFEVITIDLKAFHAFYVLGGNTFVLRQAMYLSGFDKYLKEIAAKPKYLYVGYSAGICVLSENLHGLEIVDSPNENPYNYENIIWEGIGIIDYQPMPHYKSEHPESALVDEEVEYCKKNNIAYRTLHDGDVIIEDTL